MILANRVDPLASDATEERRDRRALLNTLLQEQSDAALVDWLNSHLESAFSILEVLANRPLGKQKPDLLRRVELQLVATSLGVADLRKMVEPPLKGLSRRSRSSSWRTRIRRYLLQEFNIINNLLR
ncbi:MAG: hypothetical protein HC866_26390 [Leptolyngbyaceae cyanobacterium RU_5_1]|nr:hypothetical protein [Leptolyngbyaceae cyanobacterium RU_5_1]